MNNRKLYMKRLMAGILLVGLSITFFACNKDNSLEEMRKNELEKLDAFIQENYPGEEPLPSGLYYFETQEGTGDTIKLGDRVQVFYATWTIDSILVDQSSGYTDGYRYEPLEFIVGNSEVVQGLEEAITYMQLGSVASLILPSELAYGQNGSGYIGGFTTLLMEVEVYKVYPYVIPEEEE